MSLTVIAIKTITCRISDCKKVAAHERANPYYFSDWDKPLLDDYGGVVGGVWSPKPATAHDVAPGSTIPSGDGSWSCRPCHGSHARDGYAHPIKWTKNGTHGREGRTAKRMIRQQTQATPPRESQGEPPGFFWGQQKE